MVIPMHVHVRFGKFSISLTGAADLFQDVSIQHFF